MNKEGAARTACGLLLSLAFTLLFVADANPRGLKEGAAKSPAPQPPKSWYFAVSGDSRDCGDLVLPRIAWSIEQGRAQTPVEFYWHLGDLRALFRIDCDIARRRDPNVACPVKAFADAPNYPYSAYLNDAWDDFIENQIAAFGWTPFILGIGNHELINRKPEVFTSKFSCWLTQGPIRAQVRADALRGVPSQAGGTYYHFIRGGVDFIYLDNAADDVAFSNNQLAWLAAVLKADAGDGSVKTIVVGMHAALPESCARLHAMDKTPCGRCSGHCAYGMLQQAKTDYHKNVYVFASHSHYFAEYIYNTPEHGTDKALPGWLIGTGGAEQYEKVEDDQNNSRQKAGTLCKERAKKAGDNANPIQYGYLLVGVDADGKITPAFIPVTGSTPAPFEVPGAEAAKDHCFNRNHVAATIDEIQTTPACDCKCPTL